MGKLIINQERYNIAIRFAQFNALSFDSLFGFGKYKKYADEIKNSGTASREKPLQTKLKR